MRDWASQADAYMDQGRYEDALVAYAQAIDVGTAAQAVLCMHHCGRGLTYLLMGRPEEALADLTEAIELDKSNVAARAICGGAYMALEKYEAALAMFDAARRLDPDALVGLAGPADANRLLGRLDDALTEYDQLIEAGADSTIYSRRGETYMLLERYDEALADLNRALDLDAGNAGAVQCRADTYRLAGRLDEALMDYDRAIEQAPDDADLIGSRAEVHLAMGRSAAALVGFRRAVDLDPGLAEDYGRHLA